MRSPPTHLLFRQSIDPRFAISSLLHRLGDRKIHPVRRRRDHLARSSRWTALPGETVRLSSPSRHYTIRTLTLRLPIVLHSPSQPSIPFFLLTGHPPRSTGPDPLLLLANCLPRPVETLVLPVLHSFDFIFSNVLQRVNPFHLLFSPIRIPTSEAGRLTRRARELSTSSLPSSRSGRVSRNSPPKAILGASPKTNTIDEPFRLLLSGFVAIVVRWRSCSISRRGERMGARRV
ncbi:hypothetical protein BDY24DRAFT_402822 [Mrakia frigida]|uniref:uncharacterized protein n=1 Tax=Mrakia frigida TaxID=29902 RepID=UPI003FCC041F